MAKLERLLLPTDFSSLSEHAAQFARLLAEQHRAETFVAHVVVHPSPPETAAAVPGASMAPAGPPIDDLLRLGEQSLADFARQYLEGLPSPVHTRVLVGRPQPEICRFAEEISADLIVIGTHAQGVVHRIFWGSVSKGVLEHAPCPVLMVPLVREEPPAQA